MFCQCFLIDLFFYGRLILRPWLTEVRESFTRGGPWVSLEKLLLGFFSWSSLNYGVGQKVTKFGISQTFCSHARTRQNIVILKKNLLSTDGCSTRIATFGEVWPTNPWDPRATKFLQNDTRDSLRHVLFPLARCQHDHARTPYDTVIVCPMLCPNPLTPWPLNLDSLTPTT